IWTGGPLLTIDCGSNVSFEGQEQIGVFHSSCCTRKIEPTYSQEAALAVLASLGKLNRPYLTAIEEKLLSLLEAEGSLTALEP
ncbi:MAG: hypothetical protein ACRDEA_14135, partial [Microcystaceae cyanobacterium]